MHSSDRRNYGTAEDGNPIGVGKPETKAPTRGQYLLGLLVIFASVFSQYVVTGLDLVTKTLIVYGVPLLVISLIWGRQIIAKAFKNSGTAAKYGLGFFGGFTVLGIFLAAIILVVILRFDASAIDALYMPNPTLDVPPEFAWVMVWVSILVIGPVEEYLFTGFVYGGLLSLSKNRYWLGLALISSTLFSIAHMYYALIYGLISVVLFIMLLSFGMAMAATFYTSKGNLIIPAILHGVYDASAFFGIATSIDATVLIRGAMILTGIVIAIVLFVKRNQRTKTPITPTSGIPIPASQ